ncbi:MAG: single-stranded-DNA-specific exonuclease RecJ [Planctomycetes bacterium]|nr:single-stranded-DNA-specific exonuclease RecJ [Planctomycetota bacterium]
MSSATTSQNWKLRELDSALGEELARGTGQPPLLGRLLTARGIESLETAQAHLKPNFAGLHDPSQLPGMEAATARLQQAIDGGETILIHGDYDVDGTTGTTILVRLLRHFDAKVAWHIPNRFTDGYAFGDHSIRKAQETGATLVISVDNGTSSLETITELKELGIDTIVTDHHEPPTGALPPAVAIVNPKLPDSAYPFRELCGGAVAFKLAWGLCQRISGAERVRPELADFLRDSMAYVAIATFCDVVPLEDENRILAHFGLRSLSGTRIEGLRALLEVSGLDDGRKLRGDHIGFQVGPRINAPGRLETAAKTVEVLLADERDEARRLAKAMEELNRTRKEMQAALSQEVIERAGALGPTSEAPVAFLAGEGWHQGLVGIVAARVAETLHRPAFIAHIEGDEAVGSVRSVPGVDALEILRGAEGIYTKGGGHAAAAGFTVPTDRIEEMRAALYAKTLELYPGGVFPERPLWIDAELDITDVSRDNILCLDALEPYGQGNEAPIFVSRDLRLAEPPRIIGADKTHLMLKFRRGSYTIKAMAFGMAHRFDELEMGQPIHAVYHHSWNTFRGETNLELQLIDFACGTCPLD